MDPITVYRHGERWAVQGDPDTAPTAEYETREAAELAARQLPGGREVVVRDEGSAALGHGGGVRDGEPLGDDAGIDLRTRGAGSGDETPREGQPGL